MTITALIRQLLAIRKYLELICQDAAVREEVQWMAAKL